MKLWIDDIRPAPEGYIWCKSVNEVIEEIKRCELNLFKTLLRWSTASYSELSELVEKNTITLIDIDHDAGEYVKDGGDYIKLFDWLEEKGYAFPIHIHSQNPVGVENMRRIIKKNGWKEV